MSRFDYVKYDKHAMADQESAKVLVQKIETLIGGIGYANGLLSQECARAKALAFTKLEECYMWIGKAIRDDQVARGNTELQEERKNG
jgi:hypothetical protein